MNPNILGVPLARSAPRVRMKQNIRSSEVEFRRTKSEVVGKMNGGG
jgi:hypothetical protein